MISFAPGFMHTDSSITGPLDREADPEAIEAADREATEQMAAEASRIEAEAAADPDDAEVAAYARVHRAKAERTRRVVERLYGPTLPLRRQPVAQRGGRASRPAPIRRSGSRRGATLAGSGSTRAGPSDSRGPGEPASDDPELPTLGRPRSYGLLRLLRRIVGRP